MQNRRMLRNLLEDDHIIHVPGVYDGVSAKIVQDLGFKSAFISGYSLEASVLGNPDIGLATMTEVSHHARYIARSVEIPVLCDADTGYGNALNVWQTVKEFEQFGLAGIEIEDQGFPKKCGYLANRQVIPKGEMVGKIAAAVDAREDPDFLIIARSDARGPHGVDEAIRRYEAYFEAGADMAVIAEYYEVSELEKAIKGIQGPLGVAGAIPGREATFLSPAQLESLGVKMIIYGLSALFVAARAMRNLYSILRKKGCLSKSIVEEQSMSFEDFNKLIGLGNWEEIEKTFLK